MTDWHRVLSLIVENTTMPWRSHGTARYLLFWNAWPIVQRAKTYFGCNFDRQKKQYRRADPGRGGDRLRRHRDQPPVHAENHLRSRAWPGADASEPAGHYFPDLLGPDDDRLAQVRDPGAARGQPGRGRHHGADGAGLEFG